MPDLFNNPWAVGIGGGILSGFIVTFISRAVLSRRDRREYMQKVLSSNREVIYAVRPGISEGLIPDIQVVEALIMATARKYAVDGDDLYGPSEIAQELTKEVMDSSFISSKTKEEYCAKLSALSPPPEEKRVIELRKAGGYRHLSSSSGLEGYRSRMITMMSMMMGVLAALMTVVFAFTRLDIFETTSSIFKDKFTILIPMLVTLLTTVIVVFFTTISKEIRDRAEKAASPKRKESKEKKEGDQTTTA